MIVRKSEDHPGKEAGQIKGNSRSRTETGIEVVNTQIEVVVQVCTIGSLRTGACCF